MLPSTNITKTTFLISWSYEKQFACCYCILASPRRIPWRYEYRNEQFVLVVNRTKTIPDGEGPKTIPLSKGELVEPERQSSVMTRLILRANEAVYQVRNRFSEVIGARAINHAATVGARDRALEKVTVATSPSRAREASPPPPYKGNPGTLQQPEKQAPLARGGGGSPHPNQRMNTHVEL